MYTQQIDKLLKFNEIADRFSNCGFFKIKKTGITITWEEGNPLKTEERKPEDDLFDAMCNIFRFFVQKNEDSCIFFKTPNGWQISNMERVYKTLPEITFVDTDAGKISALELIKRYISQEKTNIDNPPSCGLIVKINDYVLTNWDIIEVILYGHQSHTTKYEKYEHLRKLGLLPDVTQLFINIMHHILWVIRAIRKLNAEIYADLLAKSEK